MKSKIADIREDYSKKSLSETDVLENPIQQFEIWLEEAINADALEPTAVNVATVSKEGSISSRTVLLKGVEKEAFVFYTNYNSRKGKALQETQKAALNFFWPELERQVCIEGTVEKVSEETSDTYFESRPYKSKVGAWASEQSTEILSKSVIVARFAKYAAKYITHVPRPPHWGGFAISPTRIEFWQGRPSRLHDRIQYLKDEDGNWGKSRLAP
ncbi:pyridoxamine 5'-phosphate oxidase [Flammeovirga kamogawensis]|uniref:Pyridoxine/pyridoxamine 5'-phosphate oxidase n=1 Tax=Flammeovirga kamogawensis TaxID=373891 RepID=A0ABX8GUM3_9BACT|nr:pyridoxamine 5'-phosphate oxidase [Flammeovirga kamogawensis]MBB6459848.1 pyridoxamine 5'-phosphate oxidase [Flammeovirga kamogawensis]QWG07098.1 pyridoxamine 5'-phosphate oxidase [Flammeovirga kamogawensis]TRX68919.1 pyridoxamine 5'-phosphate oxidase [Flammeovirga kamogawensis]